MKRISIFTMTLCLMTVFAACGTKEQVSNASSEVAEGSAVTEDAVAAQEAQEEPPEEDVPAPIYADQLQDGSYQIAVDSSSSMFRVVQCELVVEKGSMQAVMTMSGDGYGMVYMGTGEEALQDSEDAYIPFVLDEQGAKTFTVPVEALDAEVDCAAWSIRKEKWYDRTLIFQSDALPADALSGSVTASGEKGLTEGRYTIEVTLSGGSGRASVESPAAIAVEDEGITATIVWSSPYCEYMLVGDVRYDPIQTEGNSTFEIPIVLDEDMPISASTIAMSEPHLVEYTLHFDSSTIRGE